MNSLKSLFLFLLISLTIPAIAEVKVSGIFGSSMVLQRQTPLEVWGTADSGERVEVLFAGQKIQTKADKSGKWSVDLKPMEAGGPYTMTIKGKINIITFDDILIGEVWLCSGQSNMEWTPGQGLDNFSAETAAANYPAIRCFTLKKVVSPDPIETMEGSWDICTSENFPHFSAVGYFYARRLHQELGVPVGFINSSWGGTDIEVWTSSESYEALKPQVAAVAYDPDYKQTLRDALAIKGEPRYEEYNAAYQNDPALAARWYENPGDLSAWEKMYVPQEWITTPLNIVEGHVWFCYELELPESAAGKKASISLGKIDDNELTWINGQPIGGTNGHLAFRNYQIKEGILKAGKNQIVVRVSDFTLGGGFVGEPEDLHLDVDDESYSLAGDWYYKASVATPDYGIFVFNPNVYYSTLYNAMINPIIRFKIKGAIWYQGENNAWNGKSYELLFPNMIKDWRAKWGYDFPFYWVQLANFMAERPQPVPSQWAEVRESQTKTLSLPKTGQAVILDIGNPDDIHPRNKQDVGLRLANMALHNEYGRTDLNCFSPTINEVRFVDGHAEVSLTVPAGKLLNKNKYGYIREFILAGEDRIFHWAKARIEGDVIIVESDEVEKPVALRYAWADNPRVDLFGDNGLPVAPFRTDNWPAISK